MSAQKKQLMNIYNRLYKTFGSRRWWPADTAEEVVFGAILTQSITWKNVEQAIVALKEQGKLSFQAVACMDERALAEIIRPARFLNQKARTLKKYADYFGEKYGYSITKMKRRDLWTLREELLSLYRIGPETADSILLYALEKPIFVIDVYTKRILSRHGFLNMEGSYEDYQKLFMEGLPGDVRLYNEYHALLVHLGNRFCKPKPLCDICPLRTIPVKCVSKLTA
jgi:endonuclease-3 related protein